MFGKAKREREQLERSGTRAPATVVEIAGSGFSIGSGGGDSGPFRASEVVRMSTLRVEPEGAAPFEVRKRIRYGLYGRTVPNEGDRIEVLFDPSDHEKIVVAPPTAEEGRARTAAALSQSNLGSALGSGGAAPPPDVAAKIKQLESYRDSGAISEEHFEAAKQALLGEL